MRRPLTILTKLTDTASTSRFADIWEKAIRRYTASTGVDISAWAAVQHIDALTSIETALENGRYTFQQEHKKAEEAAKVVGPVVKFMKTFVDPAADLAEPVRGCLEHHEKVRNTHYYDFTAPPGG